MVVAVVAVVGKMVVAVGVWHGTGRISSSCGSKRLLKCEQTNKPAPAAVTALRGPIASRRVTAANRRGPIATAMHGDGGAANRTHAHAAARAAPHQLPPAATSCSVLDASEHRASGLCYDKGNPLSTTPTDTLNHTH